MRNIIVTSLLTLQIAGLFGGTANTNSSLNINNILNKNKTNYKIELAKDALAKCTPSLEIIKCTDSSIKLDIEKEKGVDGYSIYRAPSKDGVFQYVGDTKSGNFTDKNLESDEDYCYAAKAYIIVNGKKVISPVSNKEVAETQPDKTAKKDKKETTTTKKETATPQKETTTTKKETVTPKKETTTTKAENKATTNNQTTTQFKDINSLVEYLRSGKNAGSKNTAPTTPSKTTEAPKTEAPKTQAPKTETAKDTNQYDSSFASQVLKLVNQERAKGGLQPLTMSSALTAPANKRAQEIKTKFSHTRPNGTQWSTVLDEFGVSVRTAGENLAYGYNTPEAVVEGWMNSPGHRANIMNANFNKIGIGVYNSNGTVYCTQLFSN